RPGRRRPVVSGDRVFRRATTTREAGLDAELQRRGPRAAQVGESQGFRDSHAAVLRSLPEGRARAGLDGGGRARDREGPVARAGARDRSGDGPRPAALTAPGLAASAARPDPVTPAAAVRA